MTEQWQELKETITEMRDNDGTGTQQEVCKFLANYMETLEKQMQQPSEDCIRRQAVIILIDEASEMHPYKVVGDSNTYSNYNQGWSDACDWLYANIEGVPSVTPTSEDIKEAYIKGYDYGVKDWFKSKTQPCEDAVSRQAVKALIKRLSFKYYMECGEYIGEDSREVTLINALKFEECFEDLPSVKPKYTDEEIDKAQAVEQAYVDKMVELAVEETKRPKGKWIEVFVETPNDPYSYGFKSHKCSKCEYRPLQISNYCPNCGAEMSGGGEDEETD